MPVLKKIPTDLEILNTIYRLYYSDFVAFDDDDDERTRDSKVYVPIDCVRIANELKVDRDIVFGRLYSHLNNLYSYEQGNIKLFTSVHGENLRCIHFPLMSSVLASLRQERGKFLISTLIASLALIISLISLVFSISK
ncbi:hypothetical protein [Shewanella sp. YQ_9]|uniref:hypothetical protein n=1 Tax=Shewanella sp. YQ_9 TaxID=3367231 RepID=UPI00370C8D38